MGYLSSYLGQVEIHTQIAKKVWFITDLKFGVKTKAGF